MAPRQPQAKPFGRAPSSTIADPDALAATIARQKPAWEPGTSEKAYGTPGFGISFGFADPDARVGFAYAPNRMGFHNWDDPREKALRDALIRCLISQGWLSNFQECRLVEVR
jgi:CubicO group peptidase (beta-lactamase class C family)